MQFRLIRSDDFPICITLLPSAFRIRTTLRAALPALWRRLLSAGQLNAGVVIDADISGGHSIAAFGMTAFVSDAFVEQHAASPRPYLSAIVYEGLLSGHSPILDAQQVRRANSSGGLNLLILHFGTRGPVPTDPRALAAVGVAQEGFRLTHAGYRIRRILQEGYGPQQLAFLTAGGFLLKKDYRCGDAAAAAPLPPADEHPFLAGLNRDDPESRLPGTALSSLFQAQVPRFHFSPAEQRVLARAVMDEGDEEVAEALGVSADAIKKIWRRIYERVAAVDHDLVSDVAERSPIIRGKEKRRRLVRYLRYHLEELRPFSPREPAVLNPSDP
jgi:DNA-binding CsgD family transcriptional regulator